MEPTFCVCQPVGLRNVGMPFSYSIQFTFGPPQRPGHPPGSGNASLRSTIISRAIRSCGHGSHITGLWLTAEAAVTELQGTNMRQASVSPLIRTGGLGTVVINRFSGACPGSNIDVVAVKGYVPLSGFVETCLDAASHLSTCQENVALLRTTVRPDHPRPGAPSILAPHAEPQMWPIHPKRISPVEM
jgi:hypothetical protein